MNYPIDKYKSQAETMFYCLLQTFKCWGNGWQVGNVFDTLTDYVVRFPDAEPSTNAVVEAAYERWGKIQGSMCWYDDYGWWGIASAKAFDDKYAHIFGEDYQDKFQKIATDCWNTMHTGKPDNDSYKYKGGPMVWENRDEGASPGYFTSAAGWAVPRIQGGVWQYDMFKDKRPKPPETSPSNPSDPNWVLLGPFQNTVMNGLYLVLALRLAQQGQSTGTVDAANTEMAFLNEWFKLDGDESLLWHNSKDTALVRERVATYAYCEEKKSYPEVNGYAPNGPKAAWCGDQGLILGGLLDYLTLSGNKFVLPSDTTAESCAISIARGVLSTSDMVDALGVTPHSPEFDVHGDEDDYSCGSGVFWRYLLHGFSQNAELRKEVLSLVAANPENNAIYISAEKAFTQRKPQNDNTLFMEFNILAVLLAAIEILGQANG